MDTLKTWIHKIVQTILEWLTARWAELKAFLGPVTDTVHGRVNLEEGFRIILIALTSGGFIHLLQVFGLIDPTVGRQVEAIVTVVVAIAEYFRRHHHGVKSPRHRA